mgnify:CR=1 FL=1
MKWSLKIAQFKGIPVYIYATFLLIIGWVALVHWMQDHSISATIQGMALVFGFQGFLVNPFLLLIAFFVWIGAAQEAQMTKLIFAFDGIPVSNAMITDYKVLQADETLSRAVELVLAGSQQDFTVLDGDEVVGILTQSLFVF